MATADSDYLVRSMTEGGRLRGVACVTTGLVRELCGRHGTTPVAAAALGRALTGGALLGALLKPGQRLALKFEGNGPLRSVLVEADADGAVRGAVGNPLAEVPLQDGRLDVASALGRAGFLTVTRDLGLKEPYRGLVQLYTSEIGDDLAYYLTTSEQVPSAVGLGVFVAGDGGVAAAGGFLLQSVPPGDDALVERLLAKIATLPPLSELLCKGTTPEGLLALLFEGVAYNLLERRPLAFRCSCRRERVAGVLVSLGSEELGRLAAEGGGSVTCEFCREVYAFSAAELRELMSH